MRTPRMALWQARHRRQGGLAPVLAKVGMGVAGVLAGAALMTTMAASRGDGGAALGRELQQAECAESILPVRDGAFKTKGIKFCEGSEGWSVLAVMFMFYSFWGLAILVDEGFVTVLDFIVEELAISEDVAGATFMAAGGSAPEFFTNLISTFEESDTGFGTIVGSAVFNILFVISMSAFFSRPRDEVVRRRELKAQGIIVDEPWHFEPLPLTWWPLLRDTTVYCSGLSVLAIFYFCLVPGSAECSTGQGQVMWSEALVLFLMYIGYCVLMAFQNRVKDWVARTFPAIIPKAQRPGAGAKLAPSDGSTTSSSDVEEGAAPAATAPAAAAAKEGEEGEGSGVTAKEGSDNLDYLREALSVEERTKEKLDEMRKRASVNFPAEDVENKRVSFNVMGRRGLVVNEDIVPKAKETEEGGLFAPAEGGLFAPAEAGENAENGGGGGGGDDDVSISADVVEPRMRPMNWRGNPERANDKLYRATQATLYALVLPIVATRQTIYFNYDSLGRLEGKAKRRLAATYAFLMSLFWIAFFTWIMVYSAESVAATMGVSEAILGFTILAAGTSTPDLLSSVFVAQLGYGDMAVSSSIGSNVFDILVGLPIPWLLKAIVTGESVRVPTGSIGISLTVIIGMMVSLVGIIIYHDWKLTKGSAWAMLVLYFIFLLAMIIPEALK